MAKVSKVRVAIYLILGLVAWGILSRASAPSTDEALHDRQTQAVLQLGKAYRAQLERDRKEIARLRKLAEQHTRKADTLRAEREAIPLPPITPAACEPFAQRLSKCEQETLELRKALAADSAALDTAQTALARTTHRADTLENLLRTRPKPCRVFGVACPKVGIGPTIGPDLKPELRIGVFIPLF